MKQWELSLEQAAPQFVFPEEDLMTELVDLYFSHVNNFIPFLHRPTFMKLLAQKTHLHDAKFGRLLLVFFAVAARYSDDPRVLLDGTDSPYSRGWKWYQQALASLRPCLYMSVTLHEIQLIAVNTIYPCVFCLLTFL